MAQTVWTIGHSNHPIERFLELLAGQSIEVVADVRRFPSSRAHPQFHGQALAKSLVGAGIGYQHFLQLGGRRKEPLDDSPNTAWRVEAFNAYADHMLSAEASAGWDAFLAQGWTVLDILPAGTTRGHELPPLARIQNGSGRFY